MKRSRLEISDANRVIEIEEVFLTKCVSGGRKADKLSKILRFTSSDSVAASIVAWHPPNSCKFSALGSQAKQSASCSLSSAPPLNLSA
jgi:hypothetical protein